MTRPCPPPRATISGRDLITSAACDESDDPRLKNSLCAPVGHVGNAHAVPVVLLRHAALPPPAAGSGDFTYPVTSGQLLGRRARARSMCRAAVASHFSAPAATAMGTSRSRWPLKRSAVSSRCSSVGTMSSNTSATSSRSAPQRKLPGSATCAGPCVGRRDSMAAPPSGRWRSPLDRQVPSVRGRLKQSAFYRRGSDVLGGVEKAPCCSSATHSKRLASATLRMSFRSTRNCLAARFGERGASREAVEGWFYDGREAQRARAYPPHHKLLGGPGAHPTSGRAPTCDVPGPGPSRLGPTTQMPSSASAVMATYVAARSHRNGCGTGSTPGPRWWRGPVGQEYRSSCPSWSSRSVRPPAATCSTVATGG